MLILILTFIYILTLVLNFIFVKNIFLLWEKKLTNNI